MTRSLPRATAFMLGLMVACLLCLAPSAFAQAQANDQASPASADAELLADVAADADEAATDADEAADEPAASSQGPALDPEPANADEAAQEPVQEPVQEPAADEEDAPEPAAVEEDATPVANGADEAASPQPAPEAPVEAPAVPAAAPKQPAAPAATATPAAKPAQVPAKASAKQGPLAAGTYVIDSAKAHALLVDVKGNSAKAGADVRFVTDSGKKSQQWTFTYNASKNAYTIMNANSKKYLAAASAKAGANVLQAARKTASKLQWWVITKVGSAFKVASFANKKLVLDAKGGKPADGTTITLQKASGKASQKFYLLPTAVKKPAGASDSQASGFYTVAQSASASNVLNVAGAEQASGTNVNVAGVSGAGSQKWQLKNLGKGLYSLINIQTGKALSATGRAVGSNVDQQAVTSSAKQKWYLVPNADGSISLVSKYNGLMLRTSGSSTKSGTNVLAGLVGTGAAQKFTVAATDLVESGYYSIALRKKSANALEVPSSSTVNGKQLKTGVYEGSINQKFYIEKADDGSLAIMSLVSGKYLGDSGAGKLVQSAKSGTSSQQWIPSWKHGGIVLTNVATGKSIYVSKPNKEGQSVTTKAAAQALVLAKGNIIDNGTYFLQTALGKRIAGVKDGSKAQKANILLNTNQDAQYQKFNITYLGKGAYKIVSANGGKALTVAGTSNKANVYQKKYTGANTQKWVVEVSPRGGLVFVNKASGKALDVSGGKAKTGANVDARTKNTQAAAERWNLLATVAFTPLQLKAYNRVKNATSKTNYALVTDLSNHWTWVFERASAGAPWKLKYEWICTNGAHATPTPAVNLLSSGRRVFKNGATRPDGTYYGSNFYYLTHIQGGKYYHSPLYKKGSMTRFTDGRMGIFQSHGCIRLQMKNAIWVYKNATKGTRIITYY